MKAWSTFFFLTSNAGHFVSLCVNNIVSEVHRELDGFRYSKCQNQDNRQVNGILNAGTSTSTTNGHAMFSLNTKIGTGMILLKKIK